MRFIKKKLKSFKESPEIYCSRKGQSLEQVGSSLGKLSRPDLFKPILKYKIFYKFPVSIRVLFLYVALIISGCSGSNFWSDYTPSVNSRGTMTECVEKGLDESPLIECSSARVDEQVAFCDNKAKEQVGWFWRNLWHPVVLSPFRTEVHEAARVEQRCLENTGIAFDNAAW